MLGDHHGYIGSVHEDYTVSLLPFIGSFQEMFEKVNKAYEFLCTKSAKILDGPDPENIILILKTQSILFNRHKQGNLHEIIHLFL